MVESLSVLALRYQMVDILLNLALSGLIFKYNNVTCEV